VKISIAGVLFVLAAGCTTAPEDVSKPAESSVIAFDTAGSQACTALTPAAIQTAIDRIGQAQAEAQLEYNAFFVGGGYPAASQQGLTFITQALDEMVSLREWLRNNNVDSPFVSNTSGAYTTHWHARTAANELAYGEHWSAISAVNNLSLHGKAAAELAAQATALLADIGGHGVSCYMSEYFP
jgi:hypothetical protein